MPLPLKLLSRISQNLYGIRLTSSFELYSHFPGSRKKLVYRWSRPRHSSQIHSPLSRRRITSGQLLAEHFGGTLRRLGVRRNICFCVAGIPARGCKAAVSPPSDLHYSPLWNRWIDFLRALVCQSRGFINGIQFWIAQFCLHIHQRRSDEIPNPGKYFIPVPCLIKIRFLEYQARLNITLNYSCINAKLYIRYCSWHEWDDYTAPRILPTARSQRSHLHLRIFRLKLGEDMKKGEGWRLRSTCLIRSGQFKQRLIKQIFHQGETTLRIILYYVCRYLAADEWV